MGWVVSLGRWVKIEHQKREITSVGIDTTVLDREKGKEVSVNTNCPPVYNGNFST